MAKVSKKLKKDAKKLGNKLCGKKSLTLRHSYSFTTALYGKKKKNKPYFSISMQGNCKIPVFKLVMILLAVGTALTLLILGVRSLIESIRRKRFEEELLGEEFCFDEEDVPEEELPF